MSGVATTQIRQPRRGRIVLTVIALALGALIIAHLLRHKETRRGAGAQVVKVSTATLGDMPVTLTTGCGFHSSVSGMRRSDAAWARGSGSRVVKRSIVMLFLAMVCQDCR